MEAACPPLSQAGLPATTQYCTCSTQYKLLIPGVRGSGLYSMRRAREAAEPQFTAFLYASPQLYNTLIETN